jgi:DNA-3-methyladenine glycosylase
MVRTGDAVLHMASGEVLTAAQTLLGWIIRTEFEGSVTEVRLTETEAYAGEQDPASHAYRGETARNVTMFGPPGTLYVYRSYGIHWCMNVVVAPVGTAHAVLLRGGEPVVGGPTMEARRGRGDHLADGPGKLCQALGVSGSHDGTSLIDGPVRLLPRELPSGYRVSATPRIGISRAADRLWRFVAKPAGRATG